MTFDNLTDAELALIDQKIMESRLESGDIPQSVMLRWLAVREAKHDKEHESDNC